MDEKAAAFAQEDTAVCDSCLVLLKALMRHETVELTLKHYTKVEASVKGKSLLTKTLRLVVYARAAARPRDEASSSRRGDRRYRPRVSPRMQNGAAASDRERVAKP